MLCYWPKNQTLTSASPRSISDFRFNNTAYSTGNRSIIVYCFWIYLELESKRYFIENKLKSGEIHPQSAQTILHRKLQLFYMLGSVALQSESQMHVYYSLVSFVSHSWSIFWLPFLGYLLFSILGVSFVYHSWGIFCLPFLVCVLFIILVVYFVYHSWGIFWLPSLGYLLFTILGESFVYHSWGIFCLPFLGYLLFTILGVSLFTILGNSRIYFIL
jgi:hypothetical protein